MTDGPARRGPLLDTLGQLIQNGKELAAYLWQVPDDEPTRRQLGELAARIREEGARQGRREMGRVCDEIERAAAALPTPQQVDLLQDAFERLYKLWQSTKSGLL
jgi:hypothetical protein